MALLLLFGGVTGAFTWSFLCHLGVISHYISHRLWTLRKDRRLLLGPWTRFAFWLDGTKHTILGGQNTQIYTLKILFSFLASLVVFLRRQTPPRLTATDGFVYVFQELLSFPVKIALMAHVLISCSYVWNTQSSPITTTRCYKFVRKESDNGCNHTSGYNND